MPPNGSAARGMQMVEPLHSGDDWRSQLRAKIGWTLAVKCAALILLWFLFFRGHP
jgi:hypothetical protein